MRLILVLIVFFLGVSSAHAQYVTAANVDEEYGAELGDILPNQVKGVKKIMPAWGVHYALRLGPGLGEIGVISSNAHGSSYHILNLGYRVEYDLAGFVARMAIGPALHYYNQQDQKDRTWTAGGYAEVGAMLPVSQNLFLNSNLRFHISPGTSLYFGFGLALRF